MVNTWKNIHKNETFGKKYKDYKNDIKNNQYHFFAVENIGYWSIGYDQYHNVYCVSCGCYTLNRLYKTKKTAKQFIKNHYCLDIDDLKSRDLS